jgi:predicted Zn-dependent protease
LTLSAAIDLALMRASTLLETDPAAAAMQAGAILANEPRHEAASLLLAAACRRLGEPARALSVIESLASAHPGSAFLQLELGRTYVACARNAEARAALQRAVEADAALADAWRELSEQCLLAGDIALADMAYGEFRKLTIDPPDLADAYFALDQNRLEAAESAVHARLQAGTNQVAAFTLLAAIASRRDDVLAQEEALQRVLALAPCDNSAREQLARLLIREGRTDEALPVIERLLLSEPDSRVFLLLKADVLRIAERLAESLAIIAGLSARYPDDPDYWLFAGNLQRYMGDPRESINAYRRAIEIRPGYGAAYLALSNLKTFRFSADDIEAMRRRLANLSSSQPDMDLEFALAKALEDEVQFAESFEHYREGNRLARAEFKYDANATTAFVQRFKATFTERFFAERRTWGLPDADPIFIVGLPRSGSTLLEQILASHSEVEGTRELMYIPTMARKLAGPPETAAVYPENLVSLCESDVEQLAARYLASAQGHRILGRRHFIDKMHGNFVSLGLIHLMFPRATVIDSRRHPLGSGFACYKQTFNPGMDFAYDLNEIGRYYRDYADLMAHIDTALPGRVYRVYYELLVSDTENQIRRLLDHCRLRFEPEALRYYENRRVAQTLSSEQVRRPIYTEAVDQWRHFEPWLGPLKAALEGLIDDYPSPNSPTAKFE